MRREFEEARHRIAEAERTDAEARRVAAAGFRGDLDVQVEEKRHRNDKEREAARRTQLMLQERARAAERELREAREVGRASRSDYGMLLAHQMRFVTVCMPRRPAPPRHPSWYARSPTLQCTRGAAQDAHGSRAQGDRVILGVAGG